MSRGKRGGRGGNGGRANTYSNVRANNSQPQHFVNPSRNNGGNVSLNHSSSAPSPAQYVPSQSYQAAQQGYNAPQSYTTPQNYPNQYQGGSYNNQGGGYGNQGSGYQNNNHSSSGKERSRGGLLGQSPYARAPQNDTWSSAGPGVGRSGGGYGGPRAADPGPNIVDAMTANITQIVSKNLASILQTNQGGMNNQTSYHSQDPSRHSSQNNNGSSRGSYRRSPPRSRGLENRLGPVQPQKTTFIVRDNIGKYNNNRGAGASGAGRAANRRPPPQRQNNQVQNAKKQKVVQHIGNPKGPAKGPAKGSQPAQTNNKAKKNQKKKSRPFMKFLPAATKAREARWKTVKVDYKITVLENAEKAAEPAAAETEVKEEAEVVEMKEEVAEVVNTAESEATEVVQSETPEPTEDVAEHETLDFTIEEDTSMVEDPAGGDEGDAAVKPEASEVMEVVKDDASADSSVSAANKPSKITYSDLGDDWKDPSVKIIPGKVHDKRFKLPSRTRDDIIKVHIEKAACAIHSLFVESENKIAELLGKAKAETPYFSVTLSTSAEDIEAAPGKLFEESFIAPARSDFKFINSIPIFNDDEWELKGGD